MEKEQFEDHLPSEDGGEHSPLLPSRTLIIHGVAKYNPPRIGPKKKVPTTPANSKIRILKNVLLVSFGMFLFFSGFQSLANLQSTMNAEKGLGMDSQAVIYGMTMISAILLPKAVIKRLGCKRTLVVMIALSVPYIVANFYPRWQSLIPTAFLLGLASGPLNAAQCLYVNEMALRYQALVPYSFEVVSATFYGIYSFFTENTQIWGNFISYYVLKPHVGFPYQNYSKQNCGVDFDRTYFSFNVTNSSNPNLYPPSDEKRYILTGINTLLGVLSVLALGLLLDTLGSRRENQDDDETLCSRLLATVSHLWKIDQLLLLPLTVFLGLEIAFYTGDFTQAYIACYWGVHHVGFVVMCFGLFGAISAITVGLLVKCFGHTILLVTVAVIHCVVFIVLFTFNAETDADCILWFFVISGIWGALDAIWWSQISTLYGLLFPGNREAAFSNFSFWTAAGYFLSYSYANNFETWLKICILLGFLTVGTTCFVILQIKRTFCRSVSSLSDDLET